MPYYAHVVNERTESPTVRRFDTAELAARNLAMLMRRSGYTGASDATVARLLRGETLHHKGFAYRVSDKP